jgi:hypothetical protein
MEEAEEACSARGGRLANFQTLDEARALQEFVDGHQLGVGLRNTGDGVWKFHGNETTPDDAYLTQLFIGDDHWRSRGCARLGREGRRAVLEAWNSWYCEARTDWICEGTLENRLTPGVVVRGDLKADEGAFCLWHLPRAEDADYLPNDEEAGFDNTDLACRLQTGSSRSRSCEFSPSSRRRGLVSHRGHYSNKQHYPVMGSEVGWTGDKANATFLTLDNAYDAFHCHFTPENSGLLRMYAMQHMYERNYPGALKRTCGCGFKFLSNLVSRCDCTRNGVRSNNCATWHQDTLRRATEPHPVGCNNCNSASKI